jgi:hypothetical protein
MDDQVRARFDPSQFVFDGAPFTATGQCGEVEAIIVP